MPDWLTVTDGPPPPGATVVDGRACVTRPGLFDEWAWVLQFPTWFGRNCDAFADCLRTVTDAAPLTVEVTDADRLLADEPPDALATFLRVLADLATEAGRLRVVVHTETELPEDWAAS